jgi:hypothetical protein
MSRNIVLNRKNIISSNNNKLRYNFPRDVKFEEGDTLAISHFNIYFSFFNITAAYNNNKFSYVWWDTNGELTQTFNITIKDGYYSTASLYEYIQAVFVENGHYLIVKETGNYMYFIELVSNETYYGLEFRISSLAAMYNFNDGHGLVDITTKVFAPDPAVWAIPATRATPQVIIPSNNNFNELIGFSPQTMFQDVTGEASNDTYSFLSDKTPNMEPSSSFIITCNLVDNDLGIPNNILYAFTIPNGVTFGELITSNTDIIYSKIKPGTHSHIDLAIYDQDFRELNVRDPNILIVLSILKNKNVA